MVECSVKRDLVEEEDKVGSLSLLYSPVCLSHTQNSKDNYYPNYPTRNVLSAGYYAVNTQGG